MAQRGPGCLSGPAAFPARLPLRPGCVPFRYLLRRGGGGGGSNPSMETNEDTELVQEWLEHRIAWSREELETLWSDGVEPFESEDDDNNEPEALTRLKGSDAPTNCQR